MLMRRRQVRTTPLSERVAPGVSPVLIGLSTASPRRCDAASEAHNYLVLLMLVSMRGWHVQVAVPSFADQFAPVVVVQCRRWQYHRGPSSPKRESWSQDRQPDPPAALYSSPTTFPSPLPERRNCSIPEH